MSNFNKILLKLFSVLFIYIFLTAFYSLNYSRKAETLPNMPKGNPDLSLGIVVRPNSTGVDVLADSSQNIRFGVSTFRNTHIERLVSSSRFEYTPKKFIFTDDRYGFSSDCIYDFIIGFNLDNHQWSYIQFKPFPSVTEWAPEEKLIIYLNSWVKTFEAAGWKRIEYPKSDNPVIGRILHFQHLNSMIRTNIVHGKLRTMKLPFKLLQEILKTTKAMCQKRSVKISRFHPLDI